MCLVLILYLMGHPHSMGFPCGSAGKESACNVGELDSIPGLGRSPEEGNSHPFQHSGLENSMGCIVYGVVESQTWLSNFHLHYIEYIKISTLLGFTFFTFQDNVQLPKQWPLEFVTLTLYCTKCHGRCVLSCFTRAWLFESPWTIDRQVPLSVRVSRQEYWSGLPFPPPGNLLDSGLKCTSLMSSALAGGFFN